MWKRFVRAIKSLFGGLISSIEDPKLILEQNIREMNDQIPKMNENIATVKIVNDEGRPVTQDARDFLEVKELSTVVVKGTAKRDDQGNLTVAANKIFVRKD